MQNLIIESRGHPSPTTSMNMHISPHPLLTNVMSNGSTSSTTSTISSPMNITTQHIIPNYNTKLPQSSQFIFTISSTPTPLQQQQQQQQQQQIQSLDLLNIPRMVNLQTHNMVNLPLMDQSTANLPFVPALIGITDSITPLKSNINGNNMISYNINSNNNINNMHNNNNNMIQSMQPPVVYTIVNQNNNNIMFPIRHNMNNNNNHHAMLNENEINKLVNNLINNTSSSSSSHCTQMSNKKINIPFGSHTNRIIHTSPILSSSSTPTIPTIPTISSHSLPIPQQNNHKPVVMKNNHNDNTNIATYKEATMSIATRSNTVNTINTINTNTTNTINHVLKPMDKPKRGRKKIDRTSYLNAKGRYQCTLCVRSYKRFNDLKGHWNVHESKTKGCPYCGKKFSRPVYLNDHVRSHTGEKPFQCNICLKKFGAKRNLTQHKKIHLKNGQAVININHKYQ